MGAGIGAWLAANWAAAASVAVGVGSAIAADANAREAARDQKKAQKEAKALQSAQAAQERRQQIREERVKRAQIIQASTLTGVEGSSGEAGAVAGLSSQLGANQGFNLNQIRGANRITDFNQSAQDSLTTASNFGRLSNIGMSIFSQQGGFNAFKSVEEAPIQTTNTRLGHI